MVRHDDSAEKYYQLFYSFHGHGKALKWYMLSGTVFAICFIVFSIFYLFPYLGAPFGLCQKWAFGLMIASEIVFLSTFLWANHKRELRLISSLTGQTHSNGEGLNELKVRWLSKHFRCDKNKFLELANSIDKSLELQRKYKIKYGISREELASYIYSSDAKPRIIALFLALCSLLWLLFLKHSNGIEAIGSLLKEYSSSEVIFLVFIIALALLSTLATLKVILLLLSNGIALISTYIKGYSSRETKILVSDLARYYSPIKMQKTQRRLTGFKKSESRRFQVRN